MAYKDLPVRYTMPSRLDLAPYGTIVKVIGDNDYELYVQLATEEGSANWKKVRNLLEFVFSDYLCSKDFMDACLDIYCQKGSKESSLKKISELLMKAPTL